MKKIIKTPEPVVLDGFQAVLQVSQFGKFQLEAILDESIIDILEADRPAALDWAASKQKKRNYTTNDEPRNLFLKASTRPDSLGVTMQNLSS